MSDQQNTGGVVSALVLGAASIAVYRYLGQPVMVEGEINPLPAAALAGAGVAGLKLSAHIFGHVANLAGYLKARVPTGNKGKARFVQSLHEVRRSLIKHGWGPYFGTFKGVAVFPAIEAVSYCIGPTGTGKSVRFILIMILSLKRKPKAIYDYKSDLIPQVARTLRNRGERLNVINLGGLFEKEVGQPTDTYNPLILIFELFFRPGGLEDVSDKLRDLAMIIDPDEKKSDVENGGFWKSNNRRLISFAILVTVLIDGEKATLGKVLQLINDKLALLKHAQWVAGRLEVEEISPHGEVLSVPVEFPLHDSPWVKADIHDLEDITTFQEFLRALASGIADVLGQADGKLADSMLSGARESALAYFDITTRANKLTQTSSFRFSDMKEKGKAVNVAIMLDPNKKAQHAVLGVLHWCMLTELKRHKNKSRKVYILADEAANLPWANLEEDLTTLRAYGAVPILAFQNYPAFSDKHGKVALETLLSEAQVALFMPGQKNPETLTMIRTQLGNRSVVSRTDSASTSTGAFSMDGYGLAEEGIPLMDEEEIRTTKKGILLLGTNKPMLVDLPGIAETAPFKRQLDPSPFYGKPYRKWTKFRIKPYPRSLLSWAWAGLRFVLTGGRIS